MPPRPRSPCLCATQKAQYLLLERFVVGGARGRVSNDYVITCRHQSCGIKSHNLTQTPTHVIACHGIAHLATHGKSNFWNARVRLSRHVAVDLAATGNQ